MNILSCDCLTGGSLVGGSVHIYEVMSRLSRMGHDIVSLGGDFLRSEAGTEANPKIPLWRRIESRLLQWPVFQPFRSELSILGVFRHEIYVFLSALISIARRRGRIDIIYRRHHLFNSEYLLAKLFKIPSVKEVNGIVADETKITKRGDRLSLWVINRIERFNMPRANKFIVVTSRLKEVLEKDYGVPEDKITVISNGANTDLFKPMDATKAREKLSLNQSSNYVCFVGALYAWQGVEYLVKSAPLVLQKCPEARFLIVGEGQMKQELIELAEQIGVSDKVIFTGVVPYQQVPLYMNAGDVCVVPAARNFRSERIGGSALKLYEYMACGKPVVVGDIDGQRELISESNAGYVVRTEEPAELAGTIIRLLKDRELSDKLGENGRRAIINNHSWASVSEKVAEVCQSVIK